MKSASWVSWHEKQVYRFRPEEHIENSTGVSEEKHGSEWRGRDHHGPTDQGSVSASRGLDGKSDGGGGGCLHQQILFSDKPC